MSVSDLLAKSSLPTSFRGYARPATDELLGEIESSYRELVDERNEARLDLDRAEARIAELESLLADHDKQRQAVSDALISAERLRAEIENQANSVKTAAETEADDIVARAEHKADAIRRDAEAQADALVGDVQRALKVRQDEAETFLHDTKEQLSSLVRDLLGRIESSWDLTDASRSESEPDARERGPESEADAREGTAELEPPAPAEAELEPAAQVLAREAAGGRAAPS
jgi:cell division septum initiation protein DivIVA